MKTMNHLKRLVLAAGFMLLLIHPQIGKAQLSKFLINLSDTSNYFNVRPSLLSRIDSLRNVLDSATFYSGAGEYKELKRFDDFWMPRLYPHGRISKYLDYEGYFMTNLRNSYDYYTEEPWVEIGPFREEENYRHIGPTEFVKIFNDGTPQSTRHMLTGSLPGGLFYSDNWGENWSNAGTDKWERSGVSSAVFNPKNVNAWFASSSGGGSNGRSVSIGKTGGIYRTYNQGLNWHKIADYQDLGGKLSTIYKIEANPADTAILYAVTNQGIYRTTNAQVENPVWEQVKNCFAFDIEVKPNFNDIMYATIYDKQGDKKWKIMKSVNRGLDWTPYPIQPPIVLDLNNIRINSMTIETSLGMPDNLYCLIKHEDSVYIYYANVEAYGQWNLVGKHYDISYFGDGHTFGVDQIQGKKIISSLEVMAVLYDIESTTSFPFSLNHADCEDVVFHPYAMNQVYISTHGGVEKIEDISTSFQATSLNEGLGVGQVLAFATSMSDLKYVMASFDHDGTKLTKSTYTTPWLPFWKHIHGGDGLGAIIDPKYPNYMWAASQHGNWRWSENYFDSSSKVPNPANIGTSWGSVGVLNKFQSNVFYRNNFNSTKTNEDIYRSKTRGAGGMQPNVNEYISDFESLVGNVFSYSLVLNIASSNTDENSLLVHIIGEPIALAPNALPEHQLWINRNALSIASTAINTWQQITLPRQTWISDIQFHPDDLEKIYVV